MKIFITGTDTNVGKTFISTRILQSARESGLSTLGLKPISSGMTIPNQNEDALALQHASSIKLPYEKINPFSFKTPTAPHIAAAQEKTHLSVKLLSEKMQDALNHSADALIIEGAGGWLTPLNDTETMADFVIAHNFPVLLVVGIRLGCINHSLLTERVLLEDKINVAGWVANCIDPTMLYIDETIQSLKSRLPFSYLGTIKFGEMNRFPKIIPALTGIISL